MLGRQVGTSLLRLPRCAHLPTRSLPCHQQQYDLAIRTLAPSTQRFYAEATTGRPGRPKKAVGEPSRPVKRAVKRAAKSPKEDAATQKVKARKETAAKKTKKAAATKPRPLKKKELSEEEKAKQAERLAKRKANKAKALEKADTAELKKMALAPPHIKRRSAWRMFIVERGQYEDRLKGISDHATLTAKFGERQHELRDEYRNLTPAEVEHYNHLTHTAHEAEQAAYKAYVESYTVDEIDAANRARSTLRRRAKGKPTEVKKWVKITDERSVKRPMTQYMHFVTNRWSSGDFKNMKVLDATKLISQEWKALAEDEKKKYTNLFKQDLERYTEEYTGVHGHEPPHTSTPTIPAEQPAQAAAAAA